jgi:hypothetical protein
MGNKKKYFGKSKQAMPIVIQAEELRGIYPNSNVKVYKNYRLEWYGELRPTSLSENYRIRLTYKLSERPNVWVVEPELKQYDDKPIQHRFGDGTLCLFRFKYCEWDETMSIARTIIPWTSLWLFYYEIWLATGEWYGGGEHPKSKDD